MQMLFATTQVGYFTTTTPCTGSETNRGKIHQINAYKDSSSQGNHSTKVTSTKFINLKQQESTLRHAF